MKILQVAEAVHPSWGGIAEGIYQQGFELKKLGISSDVLSADVEEVSRINDFGGMHYWFPPKVKAWGWSPEIQKWLSQNIIRYDLVVLNGLWQGPLWEAGRACRKARVPYVVMPHGMLDPYFLGSSKQKLIKRLYWNIAEGPNIKGSKGLLFTAEAEEQKARDAYPLNGVKSWQVGYGIADPNRTSTQQGESSEIKLLFMSRVHPKKGLEITLSALAEGPQNISIDICGSGDSDYVEKLKVQFANLGERVRWRGFTSGEDKWKMIEQCDAMILTSHQENFGVIVAEAMSLSRPVLISKEVNIWKEVEGDGAGFSCESSKESAKRMIDKFAKLTYAERLEMGARARTSFLNRFTIQNSVAKFARALKEAAGK